MKDTKKQQKPKNKVKFIITHSYSEGISMEKAIKEVVESNVLKKYSKYKNTN